MARTRFGWLLMTLIAIGWLVADAGLVQAAELPVARNLELAALQEAVRWPHPSPRTVLTLAGQFLASRRADEGYTFFQERATSQPDQPLFLALEGLFQAGMAGQVPISANLPLCPRAPRLLHAAFCCLSGHAQARWSSQVRTVDS